MFVLHVSTFIISRYIRTQISRGQKPNGASLTTD